MGFQSRGKDYGGYTVKEIVHTEVLWDLNLAENGVGTLPAGPLKSCPPFDSSDYLNQNETVPFVRAHSSVAQPYLSNESLWFLHTLHTTQ